MLSISAHSPAFGWILFQRGLRVDVVLDRPLEPGIVLAVRAQSFEGDLEIHFDLPAASCDEVPDRLVDELVLWPAQYFAQHGEARLHDGIDPVGRGLYRHPLRVALPS